MVVPCVDQVDCVISISSDNPKATLVLFINVDLTKTTITDIKTR